MDAESEKDPAATAGAPEGGAGATGRQQPPPAREEPLGEPGLKALQAEREKVAELERRLRQVTQKEEEREREEQAKRDAQLPEIERLRRSQKEAEQQLAEATRKAEATRQLLVRERIDNQAERVAYGKMRTPGLFRQLYDRDAVKYDEATGRVEGLKEELERVLKQAPELSLQGDAWAGSSPAPRGRPPAPGAGAPPQGRREVDIYEELDRLGGYHV